jgi:hypothetical protein
MGLDRSSLTPEMRRLMNAEDRTKYDLGLLPEESMAKGDGRLEKYLHDEFINFCHKREIDFCHARPDKKSTIAIGRLDFLCWKGRLLCFVEFKARWGRLSDEQKAFLATQKHKGTPCLVTKDLAEATQFVTANLFPSWIDRLPATPINVPCSATTVQLAADLTGS